MNFVSKPRANVLQLAFFDIFVFDLEFDIDLEIVTICKCITKKFKHTLKTYIWRIKISNSIMVTLNENGKRSFYINCRSVLSIILIRGLKTPS